MRPRFSALLLCLIGLLTFAGTGLAAPNAPSALGGAIIDTSTVYLSFDDNSTDETGWDIYVPASNQHLQVLSGAGNTNATTAGTGNVLVALTLPANNTVTLQVASYAGTVGNISAYTNAITITNADFNTPAIALVTNTNETAVRLAIVDNASGEAGYFYEYRVPPAAFASAGSTGASISNVNFPGLSPGTSYEFRIRGFKGTAASPTSLTPSYSNAYAISTPFNAPTGFTATVQNDSTVLFTWADNSSAETGYEIQYSIASANSFKKLGTANANATSITLGGLGTGQSSLSPGQSYDFKVRAIYNDGVNLSSSASSSVVTRSTKDGFTSATYKQIPYNQSFTYQAVVTALSSRSSWNITGLPAGLTFNSTTGQITGAPTVTGVFNCPMTASFASGATASTTLTLRVVLPPVASTTIPAQTFTIGGNASIALSDKFSDPDTTSAARLVTSQGTMDFILYDTTTSTQNATPQTVANFLSYVRNFGVSDTTNKYDGALFHRSIPGFIVQGGAFKVQSSPNNFSSITTSPSPINEPVNSNTRGTVAMAKLGGNPNSATNQFFVNLADNSAILDGQNGGFTAFARVAGNGMAVADAIAALPTVDSLVNVAGVSNASLTDWPLTSSSSTMDNTKVVSITSATKNVPVMTYAITGNTNSSAVTASINTTLDGNGVSSSSLQINGGSIGQSNVTVTATDLDGNTVSQTFTVTVGQAPVITSTAPSASGTVGAAYSFSYTASGFPVPTFAVTAGTLPPGLSLSSAGVISGTPSTVGTFTGTITASNSAGTFPQAFSITINQAPAFTSGEPTSTGTYNTPYSFTCTASGSPAPTFSLATGALPPGLSLSTSGVISGTPSAAGTYTGTLSASNGIGSAASQNFNITIQKATATVSLGSLEQTYTGSPLAVTSTTTPSGLNVTYTYGGSASPPTGAGSYAVIATINEANYTGTANGTLVISKATATVTLGSLSQTYDGTARVATATTTPSGKTVTFTYNGSSTPPTNAGTYQVIGTIADANYAGVSTAQDLVVAKATATVTLGSLSQTYDGTARVATATTAPSGKTVTFTYDGSSTPPTAAGTYQVIGTIVDANYAGTSTPQDLVVAKATATVTLGSLSQTYDGTARVATATTTPAGKTVTFTYDGSSTPPTNAGTYQVIGTIVDANYAGTSTTQDLVVAKATATVTLGSLSQTYDGTARVATATTTPSGKTVTFTYNGSSTPPTNAGTYQVIGTVVDANYAGTSTTQDLVVAKATASLSLGSLSATYDGSAHAATASTTPSGLAVVFTYDSSPTAPTNAGTYAVAASINDTNYQGTATGSLTIAKASASLLLGSLAQTYDGSPKSATATTTPAGLSKSFTYDSSPTAPTNAGSYAVVGTINEANYTGTASGTLVISKATATITLNGTTQTYDGSAKSVSPSTTPSGLTVNVTYDGSPTAPINHGTYAVAASINDANYTGSTTGTLAITGQSAGSWRTQHFTSTQISNGQADDNADPDGDGIKNLIEYALGTDPLARTAALSPIHDANGLTLIFTRPKDLPDVSYSVESTDDLSGWNELTLEVITDGPVQTLRARDPLTTGNPNRRFIRLVLIPVTLE